MKSIDVKSSTYFNFNKENNKEDLQFNIGDKIRISEYQNILVKSILQIGLKRYLCLKKV